VSSSAYVLYYKKRGVDERVSTLSSPSSDVEEPSDDEEDPNARSAIRAI